MITAQQLVNDQKAAAQKAARDGADDAALDKIEAKLRTGQIRVETLTNTLAEVADNIRALEQEVREAADKALRDETDKVIEQHAADLVAAGAALDAALEATATLSEKISRWCPDARGIATFTGSARGEISANIAMLQLILLAGAFSPELVLAKRVPLPAPMPQPVPTVHVTALKAITWLAADGTIQISSRGEDIDLSPPLAKHALKIDAVCEMRDPRRRTVKEGTGIRVGKPLYANCVKLSEGMPDHDGEREPFSDRRVVAPIKSVPPLPPGFEPLPVGPPRQVSVARNDLDLVARNNANKDNKP